MRNPECAYGDRVGVRVASGFDRLGPRPLRWKEETR